MQKLLGALLVAPLIGLCGCVPSPFYESPRVNGRVVAADTNIPIEGARAFLEEYPEHQATTDDRGMFYLDSLSKYHWCFLLPDACLPFWQKGTLSVDFPGFRAARIEFGTSIENRSDSVELTILLDKE
ncbi:hypothetical protein [Denitromonas halophila]|uniref:Carboxypeptidase regulatory-like domain-containing protein n=1 Tax=Denitromonas halophila TaxID=1629404 RepID=A0A557QI97_9RHOO|nr:hypothetical protein [Denitromonas halophila]TVO52629.1 hypothetical protein FHP91_16975 [Denitromonas halophila]